MTVHKLNKKSQFNYFIFALKISYISMRGEHLLLDYIHEVAGRITDDDWLQFAPDQMLIAIHDVPEIL